MINLNTTARDLFNKLRSRFSDIELGDENRIVTINPIEARFFNFKYKDSGQELGKVQIFLGKDNSNNSIDSENKELNLVVIFHRKMFDGHFDEIRQHWYDFLREIREFARSNRLTFDVRDIEKSNLDTRDYEYLSKSNGDKTMSESKLFGTSKTSYQDIGEARIIVKHSRPVNYNVPAGRTQHIESIYIESSNGERYRYPFKHLNGARAMAIHVANGGNSYDQIGSYISGLSEELSKLRQFKNYTQRSGVMSEALGDITSKVIDRIDFVKTEISNLQKQSYYETFKESFQPIASRDVPEEMVSEWVDALTIKTFNEELKSVFPYIYKLVAEKNDLSYEDLVTEEPEESDDESEEEITEHSLISNFEQQLETISIPKFESDCDCNEGTENPCEDCQERMQQEKQSSRGEIVEFIKSLYDSQTGQFPKGAEGVKIAVEKRFGEHAGNFAGYVVEKLSSTTAEPSLAEQPQQSELHRIRQLSGI